MKFLIPLAIVCAAAYALPTSSGLQAFEWVNFKTTHGKQYHSLQEEAKRLEIFLSNLAIINEHNKKHDAGESTFRMAINKFSDWTHEEFKAYITKYSVPKTLLKSRALSVFQADPNVQLNETVDWRQHGIVTPVKDQGQCGSCWSFSATGSLESAIAKSTGNLVSLSEQQLVDCSRSYGNYGCNGGLMDSAFDYIKENGVEREEDYPYTGWNGKCKADLNKTVATVSGHVSVAKGEDNLKAAVATIGPMSVAIDASMMLQMYGSGILNDFLCGNRDSSLNHGVLVVGYGSEKGVDYWIVKNSWGESFGEKGYFRLIRNKHNKCGISNMVSYPQL